MYETYGAELDFVFQLVKLKIKKNSLTILEVDGNIVVRVSYG
jgi:hypothetical protein